MISEKGEKSYEKRKDLPKCHRDSQWLAGTGMHSNLTILLVFISTVGHSPGEVKIH